MGVIDKKNFIEQVAFDLFLNQGYDGTSVRTICKKADIDPPTLYNFFDSKKGLFLAIFQKLQKQFMEESESYNAVLNVLPPEMQLYSIYSTGINYALTHTDETKFYFRYILFCPKDLIKEVQEIQKNIYEFKYKIVYGILNECANAGLIDVDTEHATAYFLSFIINNCFNVVFENWRPSKEELLDLWKIFFKCRLKGKADL